MISDFHAYFENMVESELINHDLDDNWFKRIPFDLLLNFGWFEWKVILKICVDR